MSGEFPRDARSLREEEARRRFRPVPLRLLIPNVITLLALCLGMTSIRFAYEGAIEWAVVAIAAAAVLDGLDGRIARAIRGTSRFGAELDSLADFIDFGVAPAIVLYVAGLDRLKGLGWLTVLMFGIACALRLARFNVMIDDPDMPSWRKSFFVGMPAPAGAVVGLLPVYLSFLGSRSEPAPLAAIGFEAAYVIGVAMLMASRVPHYSGKSIGRVPREYVAPVLIGVAAALLMIAYYPLQSLVALSLLYIASIPFSVRRFFRLKREHASGRVESVAHPG